MYGRMFKSTFSGVTCSAGVARDVWEVLAGTAHVIVIHRIFIGNYGTAEFGDAKAQGMWPRLIRATGSFTSGSGGSGVTTASMDGIGGTNTFTVEGNNTTLAVAGSGTLTTLDNETFHAQAGWFYNPTPEERIIIAPSTALICTFPDDGTLNPSGDLSKVTSTITFEVIGGL